MPQAAEGKKARARGREVTGGGMRDLAERVKAGDRRALARAITLVESTRPDHRAEAAGLLRALGTREGPLRVGLSGTPGVGKSSFVERLGLTLTGRGLKLAVLAVDPSSSRSGGSILGDKTRMGELARDPRAFIRPSPSQMSLGGVGRRTRETILVAEAWGADVVLVETVGVGQSETMVADMTDVFVLLLAPGGGDELQGVKRGIMERADLILVNKADGDLRAAAERTRADYAGALRLLRKRGEDPEGYPKALSVSAMTGAGLDEAWEAVEALDRWRREAGVQAERRRGQALSWFREAVERELVTRLRASPRAAEAEARLARGVASGETTPDAAAEELVAGFLPAEPGDSRVNPLSKH
jgi:LAO/AO transport system kinase